jgi:hypothetical protein
MSTSITNIYTVYILYTLMIHSLDYSSVNVYSGSIIGADDGNFVPVYSRATVVADDGRTNLIPTDGQGAFWKKVRT